MSRTKWKIILQDIRLIDIPTRQNRMFIKIKNCVSSVTTKSYNIIDNQCEFTDPVEIEVNFPTNLLKSSNKNSKNLKIKPLRFSFRLENSSRSGFQRYGIVMVDLLKLAVENSDQVANSNLVRSFRGGLENCSEKPVFLANFSLPYGFVQNNILLKQSSQINNLNRDISIGPNSASTSNAVNNSSSQYSSPICSQSSQSNNRSNQLYFFPKFEKNSQSSSNSTPNPNSISENIQSCPIPNNPISSISIPSMSTSSPACINSRSMSARSSSLNSKKQHLDSLPIKISRQRYNELEGEIDNLLAGIINDESVQ